MKHEKIMLENKRPIEKKLEAILTSNKTTGEILAELRKLMPEFEYEEVNS